MNSHTMSVIFGVVVMICLCTASVVGISEADPQEPIEGSDVEFNEKITIKSDEDFEKVVDGNVVFIEMGSAEEYSTNIVDKIADLILNGVPVISKDKSFVQSVKGVVSTSLSESADINAIYFDNDSQISYCLSVDSEDNSYVESCVDSWLVRISAYDLEDIWIEGWNIGLIKEFLADSSRGESDITSVYYYKADSDPRYNYFFVRSCMDATSRAIFNMSNNVNFIRSEYVIENDDIDNKDRYLVDYGPTRSSGSVTITIPLPQQPPALITWSSTPKISVDNNSDRYDGIVDVKQSFRQVATLKPVNKNVSAGLLVYVDTQGPQNVSDYRGTENQIVNFKINMPLVYTAEHVLENDVVVLSKPVLLDIKLNCPDSSVSDNSKRMYSQGSSVTLLDRTYCSGYKLVGYSSDPNSAWVECGIGDTISITNDTQLYGIWEKI